MDNRAGADDNRNRLTGAGENLRFILALPPRMWARNSRFTAERTSGGMSSVQ